MCQNLKSNENAISDKTTAISGRKLTGILREWDVIHIEPSEAAGESIRENELEGNPDGVSTVEMQYAEMMIGGKTNGYQNCRFTRDCDYWKRRILHRRVRHWLQSRNLTASGTPKLFCSTLQRG